jgi:hypothetical protein
MDWAALAPQTRRFARARILAGFCPADGNILRGEDTTSGLCPRCKHTWRYDVYLDVGYVTAPPE